MVRTVHYSFLLITLMFARPDLIHPRHVVDQPPANDLEAPQPLKNRHRTSARPAAWTWTPPGTIVAPILLYHRIEDHGPWDRFRVSPEDFRLQMQTLKDLGYTAIPISLLVEAITLGARLPARPVVITFDDGWRSVYDVAFPIMRELGMTGVIYAVSTGIYSDPEMMHVPELKDLAAAGWEIGSHTRTHPDLTQCDECLSYEIGGSRFDLEYALDLPIRTIAYPFGLTDERVSNAMWSEGYTAGVGLGASSEHTPWTLYYLSRLEVHGTMDLAEFTELLPWAGPETPG